MSKELENVLEALNEIGQLEFEDIKSFYDDSGDMKRIETTEQFTIIEKALTPPTEEEVCEALSTHFENIRYSQLFVSYVGREFEVSYEPFLSQVIAYKKDDGNVSIELELPPKLGKMIFAFYEGIESK